MAKKKAVNYNPNTALIQGAATAYRNYDNVAGMYQGLEKVTQAGADLVKSTIDKRNKEIEEKNKINKLFDDAADKVLLKSGTLSESLYNSTYNELVEAKKTYLEGVNQKDDKKRIEGLKFIQNHSTFIQEHKAYNLQLAKDKKEGLLSDAHTADEEHDMTQIMEGKYSKTSRNKDGDVVFHIKDRQGNEKLISSTEYKDMAIFKNFKLGNAYVKGRNAILKNEIFDATALGQSLLQSMPNNKKDMRAVMGDDILGDVGGDKNLRTMLMNSQTLDEEIINALGQQGFIAIAGEDRKLDAKEKEAFIDAVVNVDNPMFNLDTSKRIMVEQLTNAARAQHDEHWQKINNEKRRKEAIIRGQNVEKTPSQYGYRTQGMMLREYNFIKSGEIGDEITVKIDGVSYTFTRKNDGNFEHIGEDKKSTIKTPNQIADLRELVGFDRIPDPKGKNPFTMVTNFPTKPKEE
tara:strand:+ start:992 stop:2374 length:1383 start_codon:yes stop_codon:yes gene_type:complete